MSIENTYNYTLLEKYIKEKLTQGESLSAIELIDEAQTVNSGLDLSQPQFDPASNNTIVLDKEEASASKLNNTFDSIKQDLNIIYKEMLSLSENALTMYERWKIEAESIEKELTDIEEEIENLLLLSQDTEGYHSILVDNFTDLFSLDMNASSARVNIETGSISLKPSGAGATTPTQVFLNNLDINNITFRVRSSIVSRNDLAGTTIKNIFSDASEVWHTVLQTEKLKPVVCELVVKLGDELVDFNRIEVFLHDSGHSSTMNITPLYSEDDLTYHQLPCVDYSQSVNTLGVFYCSNISARYIKFILAKNAPDPSTAEEFRYQFGFKRISFFTESFEIGEENKQIAESNWLYVVNDDGNPKEFEKLTLETCESIANNTSINYYVATTSEDISGSPTPLWYPITPVNRDSTALEILHPQIFEIGSVANEIINDITTYNDTDNAIYKYKDENDALQESSLTGEAELYSYLDKDSDGILNYLLYNESNESDNKFPVNINDSSLILYRGVDTWKFEEPYYYCVVEVNNADGVIIQGGDQSISIDDSPEESGEMIIPYGTHAIRIHKNYYSSDELSLKTLIESKVDLLAARRMEKVSVFDMLNNVANTNYDKFALDLSLPGTQENNDKTVKKVFLIKKGSGSDKFTVKFNLINQFKKYVKVKAELETQDPSITPSCDGYQLKLA